MPDLGAEDEENSDTDILLELVKSNKINKRLPLAIYKQVLLKPVGGKYGDKVAHLLQDSSTASTQNMTTAFRRFDDEEVLLSGRDRIKLVKPSQ
jgi:hypothetical protein